MCTLTYKPLGKNSYIVTHNRDEKFSRSVAHLPKLEDVHSLPVFYPKDLESNGSWILTSECVFTLCLLNGADEHTLGEQIFPKSRGQIVLDYFQYYDLEKMSKDYDFSGIGPFTLIVCDGLDGGKKSEVELQKMTWDTKQIKYEVLDASQPQIWSSSTLYNAEERAIKEARFLDFIMANPDCTAEDILQFHQTPYNEDAQEEGMVINRVDTKRKTVSISSITKGINNSCSFYYKDLINNQEKTIRIIE